MRETLEKLLQITEGCREDMHEPDEQGLSAVVFGSRFDNAFPPEGEIAGEFVNVHPDSELKVKLIRESDDEVESSFFNLADLIALARKAQITDENCKSDIYRDALLKIAGQKRLVGFNKVAVAICGIAIKALNEAKEEN